MIAMLLRSGTFALVAALLASAIGLTACTAAPSGAPGGGSQTPTGTPSAVVEATWPSTIGGFTRPTSIAAPDDGTHRLFVTEQAGLISVVVDGKRLDSPALNILSQVGSSSTERGLLDIAFPPDFADKGYAYIDFTDTNGNTRVYRIHVDQTNPNAFDPATMQLIITVQQPYPNHNGGQLAIGPDGYLYVGMGDGGSAGDPQNRAQSPKTLLGKILRLDTESTPQAAGYGIPKDNPYAEATATGLPEIWLVGLRNPWRFSFDGGGNLWIGDVGQDAWEEIDLVPPGSGGANLGWPLYEGTHLYKADSKAASGFVWPVAEYAHSEGISVTGGYVYAGAEYPGMAGRYVFGDFGTGKIWTLTKEPSTAGTGTVWTRDIAMKTNWAISTFGVDGSDGLWAADWNAGEIHRLGDLSK